MSQQADHAGTGLPVILVTGATGAQGGSVAKALLRSGKWAVRCLTRNAGSEKAIALQKAGAILVEGDLDNMDCLLEATKGCYGVFGVTNFWEHFGKEYEQGKHLIDAVLASGVKHFIYSGLPAYKTLSGDKLSVPHCDIKAALEVYALSKGIPSTFMHIAFYYENFLYFFPPQREEDGAYYFGFPQGQTPLAMATPEDMGPMAALIFDHPDIYTGKTVGVVGEDRTCSEYAAIMSRVLGVTIRYRYIPRDVYAGLGFPGAEELANMFEVQRLHIPHRRGDLMNSYYMNSRMQSFESWLVRNKSQLLQLLNQTEYA